MGTDRVLIGTVRSVTPQRRELRIQPVPAYEYALDGLKWIRILLRDDTELRCKLASIRNVGANWQALLAPGVPRDSVGRMRGAKVVLLEDELPRQADGPMHISDLLGMQVLEASGTLLGEISRVYETNANDAFTVTRPDGGSTTLPVIPEVVREVDPEARIVYVDDIAPYRVDD